MDLATLPDKISRIQVNTPAGQAGVLSFENGSYAFAYQPDGEEVSLTMPQRTASFNSGSIHPIFQMNIPEGYVRHALHERLQRYTKVNDMLFLALQNDRGIGRLDYKSDLEIKHTDTEDLEQLVHWDSRESVFAYLLNKYLLNTSISGIQPKVMAPSGKGMLHHPDLIIKTAGETYPQLALNEFVCMSIAKACGIPVPEFWLSDNQELFIMRRFDIREGTRLGMEDFAVLMKKTGDEKYRSSYEHVAKVVQIYNGTHEQLQQLFDYIAISCLLGNGDAHLKNFALLYRQLNPLQGIELSPLYDVVNTTVYPMDSRDLALTMCKSREFPKHNTLIKFASSIGVRHAGERLKEMAETAMDFINSFDRWDSFPELKNALTSSISRAMVSKSSGFNFDTTRPGKKLKTDRLL